VSESTPMMRVVRSLITLLHPRSTLYTTSSYGGTTRANEALEMLAPFVEDAMKEPTCSVLNRCGEGA
jgi:hypothetical protein